MKRHAQIVGLFLTVGMLGVPVLQQPDAETPAEPEVVAETPAEPESADAQLRSAAAAADKTSQPQHCGEQFDVAYYKKTQSAFKRRHKHAQKQKERTAQAHREQRLSKVERDLIHKGYCVLQLNEFGEKFSFECWKKFVEKIPRKRW